MSREIVLAGAVRTAIGNFGGALADTPVVELGSIVIKEALKRANVKPEDVDEVLMGCILQAAHGQNVGRQAAIGAGLPVEVPALTLNNLCGSGLKAVNLAAAMIMSGEADVVVAGGMESMSGAAYAIPKGRYGYRMGSGEMVDTMIYDALTDVFNQYHMGVTAENVAERYNITREMQDEFAAKSQQKCEAAQAKGVFDKEIVPVPVKVKKETVEFKVDELPRKGVTAEGLAKLRPAFKKDGTVTAGNASGINDAAAFLVLADGDKAVAAGHKPLARLVSYAIAGVPNDVMGEGPIPSAKLALQKAGLTLDQIDLIESNEAFASQALTVQQGLGLDPAKTNVNGGAIALGHPVGATGAVIVTKLLHEMERVGARYGMASMCIGGGQGITTIYERLG